MIRWLIAKAWVNCHDFLQIYGDDCRGLMAVYSYPDLGRDISAAPCRRDVRPNENGRLGPGFAGGFAEASQPCPYQGK
jgi:hypothetical protein